MAQAPPPRRQEKKAQPADAGAEVRAEPELTDEQLRQRERYAQLTAARADTAAIAAAPANAQREPEWPLYLRRAARHILDVISALRADEKFWLAVGNAERSVGLTADYWRPIQEVLQSDLAGLIELMGYRSPPRPTADEMAVQMQLEFAQALNEPDAALRAERTNEARRKMAVYAFRLRSLIEQVETRHPGPGQQELVEQRLLALVRQGVLAIGPAAIAAGSIAMLGPGAPVGAAALVGVGLEGARREAVGKAIQMASTGVLSAALGDQDSEADPRASVAAAQQSLVMAAFGAQGAARYVLEHPDVPPNGLVRAYVIEAVRWSFELEAARCRLPDGGLMPGPDQLAAAVVREALLELRDCTRFEPPCEDLHDIHDRLGQAAEDLERFANLDP